MTTKRGIPRPGEWVKVKLPDGRPANVTTRYRDGRRLVVVKPFTPKGAQQ